MTQRMHQRWKSPVSPNEFYKKYYFQRPIRFSIKEHATVPRGCVVNLCILLGIKKIHVSLQVIQHPQYKTFGFSLGLGSVLYVLRYFFLCYYAIIKNMINIIYQILIKVENFLHIFKARLLIGTPSAEGPCCVMRPNCRQSTMWRINRRQQY